MEWVETTGRTLEDAVDAALTVLGVDEADLEYEVVQQVKSGIKLLPRVILTLRTW